MKRKVLTILGTRPEIIRLSQIIPKLDQVCDHRVLHTGQNYDPRLTDIFFQELGVRLPDCVLTSQGSLAQQLTTTFIGVEKFHADVRVQFFPRPLNEPSIFPIVPHLPVLGFFELTTTRPE